MSPAQQAEIRKRVGSHKMAARVQREVPSSSHDDEDVPVGLHGIMAATEKLLAVNRGLVPTDERDSLEFKRLHTTDQLLGERVRLDADKTRLNVLRRAAKTRNLSGLHPGHFDAYAEGHLLGNPLSMPLEEINPLHLVEQARRVTQMGPGGLGSDEAITDEARALHPSQFGFLSSIEGPECHSDDTEVFTQSGWKFWPTVTEFDNLACKDADGALFFCKPERLIAAAYTGPMVQADARMFHLKVTPGHRLRVAPHPKRPDAWFDVFAGDYAEHFALRFDTGSKPFAGIETEFWHAPIIAKTSNSQNVIPPIRMDLWAEFMGWYLAEGNSTVRKRKNSDWLDAKTYISQSRDANPDCCERIAALLEQLPFGGKYSEAAQAFVIPGKQLAFYLQEFGFALDKFIPEYLFNVSVSARQRLFDAMLLGDGRINKTHTNFTSGSKQLATDFERLAIGLGKTTNFRKYWDNRPHVQAWTYEVSILKLRERVVSRTCQPGIGGLFSISDYSGLVYCATVPGGLLLTRRGASTGIWTGNSSRIGIDTRLAWGTKVGDDGKIYQRFHDRRSKKHRWLSPEDLHGLTVGLPD
jgi:hypothetical protein